MDTSPIPGYITRKQAADRSRRAERTLQRYWSKAMELQDAKVLSHLKLRTEDGEILDGTSVTKERIDDLRTEGKNPTWYAQAEWAIETYGPVANSILDDVIGNEADAPEKGTEGGFNPAIEALRGEIAELRRDKDRLYAELTIKNEQIKEANSRTRESNTLMQELQKMLGNWQEQAFRTLPARTVSSTGDAEAEIMAEIPTNTEQAGRASRAANRPTRKAPAGKKRNVSTAKPVTATTPRKPKWYETPTLKRIFSKSP